MVPKKKFSGLRSPKPHIWGFGVVVVFLSLLVAGCGLPDYITLEAPESYSGTLPSTVVAFTEPDDSNIIGYALYYKIYSGLSDLSSENDEDWFDEASSHYTETDIPTGSTVPNQRGFLKAGESGNRATTMWSTSLIPAQGVGTDIFIDFDYGAVVSTAGDDRLEPVVGTNWDGNIPTTVLMTLARGFRDPTNTSSDELLKFVADWDFNDGSPNDGYHDGDLRRGYNNISKQPGTTRAIVDSCGTPLFNTSPSSELYIGLVVHSFGYDPSTVAPLYSKPLYLGEIRYQQVNDVDRVSR